MLSPSLQCKEESSASESLPTSSEGEGAPAEEGKSANYTVESPLGTKRTPKKAAYNASSRTVLLSGLSFQAGHPVKVTVKNVTNL